MVDSETTASSTTRGRVRVETGAKRIRAYLGGHLVVDTTEPRLVWEVPYYPAYYLPRADVRAELVPTGQTRHSPSRGEASVLTVRTAGGEAPAAALRYEDSPAPQLTELVRLDWDAMDAWFEEDEQVHTHPRDPYKRVDVLDSSRHVRVEVDGVTVAESSHPKVLFETGLPARFYLPRVDVRQDLLEPSDKVTHCPYKGAAGYWSLRVGDNLHEDLVWTYPTPLPESAKIAGLVTFYNEQVDLFIDGVRQERPKTPFS